MQRASNRAKRREMHLAQRLDAQETSPAAASEDERRGRRDVKKERARAVVAPPVVRQPAWSVRVDGLDWTRFPIQDRGFPPLPTRAGRPIDWWMVGVDRAPIVMDGQSRGQRRLQACERRRHVVEWRQI